MAWLSHSKGLWKEHKYIRKEGEGESTRYYYTNDKLAVEEGKPIRFTKEEMEDIDRDLTEHEYRLLYDEAERYANPSVYIDGEPLNKVEESELERLRAQRQEAVEWLEQNARYYSEQRLSAAIQTKALDAYANNGLNYVETEERALLNMDISEIKSAYAIKN